MLTSSNARVLRCTARALSSLFRQPIAVTFVQVADYHPPPLPLGLKKRLTHEKLKEPTTLNGKREAFARFGAASGINPSELFPTDKEIEEEIAAEKEWWPTLQAMQLRMQEKEERKQNKMLERNKKIAENMAKMPEWIRKYKEKRKLNAENDKDPEAKDKSASKETASTNIPSFDFIAQPAHPQVRKYISERKSKKT